MLRKKNKMNEKWIAPYTITQNLDGSVHSLSEAANTIHSALQLLWSVNKESLRQAQVTKNETPYELVTEQDIANAGYDLAPDLEHECSQLLLRAERGLKELSKTELNLVKTVDNQTALLKNLQHGITQSPSSQENSRTNVYDNLKREELKNNREKLLRVLAVVNKKNTHELENINKIKAANEALSKQNNNAPSNQQLKQYESDLIYEIARLVSEGGLNVTTELMYYNRKVSLI